MINASTYIFAKFSSGYSQYPDDYSHDFFSKVIDNSNCKSELIISRQNSLVYYLYVRTLNNKEEKLGLCFVLNSVLIADYSTVFSLFEELTTKLVVDGQILKFSDTGNIIHDAQYLPDIEKTCINVSNELNSKLSVFEGLLEHIPPLNYGVAADEEKCFSYMDDTAKIVDAIHSYPFVRIVKDDNYISEKLSSYSAVLLKHKIENDKLQEVIKSKEQAISKLNKQKKRTTLVFLLLSVLFVGFIVMMFVVDSSNQKTKTIEEQQTKITELEARNDTLNESLKNTNELLLETTEELKQEELKNSKLNASLSKSERFRNNLVSVRPLMILDMSFNFKSGWLTINYYGFSQKLCYLKIVVNDNTYGEYFTVKEGKQTLNKYFPGSFRKDKWYEFKIYNNDNLLWVQRF